jgi:hypothetical protein
LTAGRLPGGRRPLLVAGTAYCYPAAVFFRKKDKPRERFYLLPGQGGRNYQRKQLVFRFWAVVVALVFGTVMAMVMWWLSRPKL